MCEASLAAVFPNEGGFPGKLCVKENSILGLRKRAGSRNSIVSGKGPVIEIDV